MIAQRFRSIGWVAGCAVAALGCYLASQTVASERAALARVDRQIAVAQDDIRRLTTEIAARGRMGQIERWNSQVLALQAPAPAQFVANEIQLASLASGKPLPLDPAIMASRGAVTTVAYEAPPPRPAHVQAVAAIVEPAQPMLRPATYVQARPSPLSAATPAPIVKASVIVKAAPVLTPAGKPATIVRAGDTDMAMPAKAGRSERADRPAKVARVTLQGDEMSLPKAHLVKVAAVAPTAKAMATPARASHSLLPDDLGTLIAAERKGGKAALKPAAAKPARSADR